jgi:hypothetical protein
MKSRGKKSWNLYSIKKPEVPGLYFVGFLYFPEHGKPHVIEEEQTFKLTNAKQDIAQEFLVDQNCLLWYGPVNLPSLLPRTMTRLKREQRKAFVRDYEKRCIACGHVAGVNARSIMYIDDPEDCKKCNGKSTVSIELKERK